MRTKPGPLRQVSVITDLRQAAFCVGLLAFLLFLHACSKKIEETDQPFLDIDDGQFDIHAVVLQSPIYPSGTPLGSGSLSFRFSGDTTGTFSATGPLTANQTEGDAVGAILVSIEDEDFNTLREGISLLVFHPTGGGKMNLFVLATELGVELDSLQAGDSYGIGGGAPFKGSYLTGIGISEFWLGEENFFMTADQAFILTAGVVSITARDSTHITGTFFGTTDATPGVSVKQYILDSLF